MWETRGDCCLKSLKEEQIILYPQHLPKKTFNLIASRKEKKYMKFVKMTFSCGNYNIFTFFRAAYMRRGPRTTKDHRKRSPFFELQAKYLCLELETSGLSRLSIFREYFSSLREDSGKIFKLMTFRRGPRTTYCTVYMDAVYIRVFINKIS